MSPNVPTRLCWASTKKLPMEFSCLKVLGRVTEWVSGRSQLVTIREKCVPYVWWDWLRAKKCLFGDSWSIPTFSSDCCCFESLARTADTQWRHKSKKFEILGRCGWQNMLRLYLQIWDWDLIFGHAVKAISSPGVRSPWSLAIRTLLCRAQLGYSLYACAAALASENYTMMNGRQITGDSYAAWPDRWRHWD